MIPHLIPHLKELGYVKRGKTALEERIDESCSTVWAGIEVKTARRVVIKVVDREAERKRSFLDGLAAREVRALEYIHRDSGAAAARLVVRPAGDPGRPDTWSLVGRADCGADAVVLEQLHGGRVLHHDDSPPGGVWARARVYPRAMALDMVRAMAASVGALHAIGVIHRDVKPANFVLEDAALAYDAAPADDGYATVRCTARRPTLRAVDLGSASLPGDPDPPPSVMIGTPAYMAPEVWARRPPSQASDMWALGVTIFTTYFGFPPFAGDSMRDLSHSIARATLPPIPAEDIMDKEILAICSALLQRDPSLRPTYPILLQSFPSMQFEAS